jgi:cellulose synthase/poly-beta-1,6-N-acetylglucosamine synthase-like glycosyltransferase
MVSMETSPYRIALIIFAQNESILIQSTVSAAKEMLRDQNALYVIADNCTDNTADLAREAGAEVFIRQQEFPHGKGAAISWFLQNYPERYENFSYLAVLDADSRINPDFLDRLEKSLGNNVVVGQCYLAPVDFENSPLSKLIALLEIVEQTVFDRIRAELGWSVRLRGTGMVFRTQVLQEVAYRIDTEVEDIALSLLMAEKHLIVKQLFDVPVHDPKPQEMVAASRQRARWFRGQWLALWKYRKLIWKILGKGLNGWSVIASVFLKPRWLKITIMIILALVLFRVPVLSIILFSLAIWECLLFLFGVILIPDRWMFVKALLFLPEFIFMWMKGIFLSLQRVKWFRARKTTVNEKK